MMLGGKCSGCCPCDDAQAAKLNESLKGMSVSCTLTHTGYNAQSALLHYPYAAVAAANWQPPEAGLPASLDSARALIPESFFNLQTVEVFDYEEPIRTTAYDLSLSTQRPEPYFVYEDRHIFIEFLIRYIPYKIGNIIDDTGCGIGWYLNAYKLSRVRTGTLGSFATLPVDEGTYGPDAVGPDWSAAAVWRCLRFDYATQNAGERRINIGFNSATSLASDFWYEGNVGGPTTGNGANYLRKIYETNGQYLSIGDSASGNIDSRITVNLTSLPFRNSAYCIHDREDPAEPSIIRSPSYTVDRQKTPAPDHIRFIQNPATILSKTIGYSSSSFTCSAVVDMVR